jgi:DNA repair protein RecN (Recombination protein N)
VYADAHFGVRKETSGERTLTLMEGFSREEHVNELAVMLSGPECSEAALTSAREMVQKAQKWKSTRIREPGKTVI